MKPEKVVKKFTAELLRKKNVVMVGLGTKRVGGIDTGQVALVVGVKQKLPLSKLAAEDVVPPQIKGLVTDVIEVGEIKLLNESPDRKKRWRPAPAGVSIGHYQVTAGTLGCLVYKNGQPLILSNNHVLANVNQAKIGDPILQPGAYDGGTVDKDVLAHLYNFVEIKIPGPSPCPIAKTIVNMCNFLAQLFGRETRLMAFAGLEGNLVDCALAKPNKDGDVDNTILEVNGFSGEVEPEVGMRVKKSGRTSGLTHGQVTQVGVTVNVNVGKDRMALFTDQCAIGAMSQPGDSGSIVLSEDNKCVGLLFAGSETVTMANRYSNVKVKLGLD
jgi:hypothetical protein